MNITSTGGHNDQRQIAERFFRDTFQNEHESLVRAAVGDDAWFAAVQRPSETALAMSWRSSVYGAVGLPPMSEGVVDAVPLSELFVRHQDEILDWWDAQDWFPVWSWLFQARSDADSIWLLSHVDQLYELGVGVMEFDTEAMIRACLFVPGAGYDFVAAHWVRLHKLYFRRW